jgi:hypothetical protein
MKTLSRWMSARPARETSWWVLRCSGESICKFVRDFDSRSTDSWVLRAVYEELSPHLQVDGHPLPMRADDRWEEDLKIDSEDMDFRVFLISRTGRGVRWRTRRGILTTAGSRQSETLLASSSTSQDYKALDKSMKRTRANARVAYLRRWPFQHG